MGIDLLTIIVFIIPVFISLELILVFIPALMSRSKVKRRLRSPPEIPLILCRPLSSEEQILMRSWYVNRSDSRNYIKKSLDSFPSVNLSTAGKENGSIRDAVDAIHEANEVIMRANITDLTWMDSLADIDFLDFVVKK